MFPGGMSLQATECLWLGSHSDDSLAHAMQVKGRLPDQVATVATVIGGLVGVGILGYLGLALSQVN